ncbi:hypothetical protein ABK040_004312, partial [Willaertia magna]
MSQQQVNELPSIQIAAILKAPNQDLIIDSQYPLPNVGESEVLVRNKYAGVNPLDVSVRKTGMFLSSFPAILGVDFSGIVVKVGSKVSQFKIGDSVSGCTFGDFRGTYSQYVVAPESLTYLNPSKLPHELTSCVGVTFLTAYQILLRYVTNLNEDEREKQQVGSLNGKKILLIGGSGGVGICAIILAKYYFQVDEIISISSNRNTELLTKLGVNRILDYSKGKEHLMNELESLNEHFDLVADLVGGYEEYYPIEILKKDQHSQFVSIIPSSNTQNTQQDNTAGKAIFGCERTFTLIASASRIQYENILNFLAENEKVWKLIPLHIFKLENVKQAHEMIEKLDNIFENTNIIYFNFANGFSLDSTDRDKKTISMIVSRIVFAAFKRSKTLAQTTPPSENNLFLYEVLRIISKKLHTIHGETVIPLVLAFDEYQLATRANSNLHTSIQQKLGWYIRKIQNRQQILLFPAFGGTFVESDVKMEPTQYTPAPLALPSLRPIDIEAIMNDMGLSELYTGRYREFWNAIGIVPRHLEWALGNDGKQLKSLVLNDETVRTIIYANVVNIVKKQYHNNLYDDYFGELALKTISGLKYNKDQRLNEYISEGKVYENDDGFIGIPLVVIDILATNMEYMPKCVVSDFITASNKPLWEKFEELCLKTMTARFNVLYTKNHSEKVQFSELFKGAHFKSDLGFMSLKTTNSSWFKYECLDIFLSSNNKERNEEIISQVCLKKLQKNQYDVDGVFCTLRNAITNKQILFVTQNKFQFEDSESKTLEPADLLDFYEKAVRTTFKESETFVIIFTNKTITKQTQEM